MKKILFGIFAVIFSAGAASAESLPTVDMGGSYNDVMDSEVRMDAIQPVLREFPLRPQKTSDKEDKFRYIFNDESLNEIEAYINDPYGTGYFSLDRNTFSKNLRNKLHNSGTKLTLGLLYDLCIPTAYKTLAVYVETYQENLTVDDSLADAAKARIDEDKKQNNGAEETCDILIQMIVLKHNQLVLKQQ